MSSTGLGLSVDCLLLVGEAAREYRLDLGSLNLIVLGDNNAALVDSSLVHSNSGSEVSNLGIDMINNLLHNNSLSRRHLSDLLGKLDNSLCELMNLSADNNQLSSLLLNNGSVLLDDNSLLLGEDMHGLLKNGMHLHDLSLDLLMNNVDLLGDMSNLGDQCLDLRNNDSLLSRMRNNDCSQLLNGVLNNSSLSREMNNLCFENRNLFSDGGDLLSLGSRTQAHHRGFLELLTSLSTNRASLRARCATTLENSKLVTHHLALRLVVASASAVNQTSERGRLVTNVSAFLLASHLS